ncbi:hypothetical protein ACFE04_021378 [Oxalis oulophora]
MLIAGIFFTVIFFSLIFYCCYKKSRDAAARRDEVMRLVAKVSYETALAEAELHGGGVGYATSAALNHHWQPPPPATVGYQCVVCSSPTTSRCKQCKAVRYCSGKCQIIHWRQGHKDECRPQATSQNFQGGDDEHVNDARDGHLLSHGGNHDMPKNRPNIEKDDEDHDLTRRKKLASKKIKQPMIPPSESTVLENGLDGPSHSRKLHKKKPSFSGVEFDVHRGKKVISEDEQANNPGRELPSSNHLDVTDDKEEDSQLFKGERVRSMSFTYGDNRYSVDRGHMATSSKPVLPVKLSGISILQQSARNGLKKVVQQFRVPKMSKSNPIGFRNEVAGKYKINFPYELFVELYSQNATDLYPFGLINIGNSCYANAVLQCLAYTRPLTSYLVHGIHSKTCRKKDWCFICEFESLIMNARQGKSPLSPIRILSKLQKIGSQLGHGTEEDAHEFLRCAVDVMQSVFLKESGAEGPLAEETTLVGLTFGGYLRSKIRCMKCLGKSERCERMMDLSVEIDGDIGSLEEALAQFSRSETLDGDNKYHCTRCNSYQKAKKKLTLLEAPNILTIVLKRFQSGSFGKLNKSVRFPEILNMAPYMSGTSDKFPVYSLYAVVVHLDVMNAADSGHYVCYVKNFQGQWFQIDDSSVTPVALEKVLLQGAYMHTPRAPSLTQNNVASYGERSKKRNLEAVPSNLKTTPNIPPMGQKKHGKDPYWISRDGANRNHSFDPYDYRIHCTRRIHTLDTSSESSSLLSSSDTSSTSTKDSSGTEDLSDYIFGGATADWYNHYNNSSDSVPSSSELVNDAGKQTNHGHGSSMYTDSVRHRRAVSNQFVSGSERDSEWERAYHERSGVVLERMRGGGEVTQTFY